MTPASRSMKPREAATEAGSVHGLTRLTVNLTRQSVEALEKISATTGMSKTDIVNRSLQIHSLLNMIIMEDGGCLTVVRSNGNFERIHFV